MGNDLTYKALRAKVDELEQQISRTAQGTAQAAQVIDDEARETSRESDQMAAKSVDRDSVSDSHEFSKVLAGLSDGILTYAAKAQDTAKQAKAANHQAHTTHGGFQEAFDRSGVDGLENLDRDWLEQQ